MTNFITLRNLVVMACIGFFILLWRTHWSDRKIPVSSFPSLVSCQLKKECAIIYIAPWCPACKQVLPRVTPFFEKAISNNDYGIQVIIGDGRTKEENQEEADAIGPLAIIDQDRSIARDLKLKGYPAFYVVNSSRKILLKDQDAFDWIEKTFK